MTPLSDSDPTGRWCPVAVCRAPEKRTFANFAERQERSLARQVIESARPRANQQLRDGDSERLRGLEVDYQLEPPWAARRAPSLAA